MRTAIALACVAWGGAAAVAQQPQAPATWRERSAPYRAAVVELATANQARPPAERLAGEALADAYLRAGAARLRDRIADLDVVTDRRARRDEIRAWCVGMAVAMDRTSMLTTHPLARLTLGEVETAEERTARTKVLGEPTLRGRGDWGRHFWVSVGIRALLGRAVAENVGVSKEFADARRLTDTKAGEGFSLGDLCADVAGIEFAERLLAGDATVNALVAMLARSGRGNDWMPEAAELPTGLDAGAAAERYGHAGDSRVRRVLADLRLRVRATPGHQVPADDDSQG